MFSQIKYALVAVLIALPGCASISEGTKEPSQMVLFTSAPSGAVVKQGPRRVCTTPCHVSRRELRLVEGYQFAFPSGTLVDASAGFEASSAVLANILFSGGVGLFFDAVSGHLWVRANHVHVIEQPAAEQLAVDLEIVEEDAGGDSITDPLLR